MNYHRFAPRATTTSRRRLSSAAGALGLGFLLTATPLQAQTDDGPSYEELAISIQARVREGRYDAALKAAEEFAAIARRRDGEDNFNYASAIGWVASLYLQQGRLMDAQPLLERSLEIYRKVLPRGHPHIAAAISNLGNHYQRVGRLEEAEALNKQALEMRETAEKPNLDSIAESLNNLAQVYKRQWRHREAIPLLRRAVQLREKVHGPDDRHVALILGNLASSLELAWDFSGAEVELRRALAIHTKHQHADHYELADVRSKLAQNLFKQRRYGEAEPLFREALRVFRLPQHARSPALSATLADLGLNLTEQDRLDEAERLLREALALLKETLPPTHPSIARVHVALSEVHARRGNLTAALEAIREASQLRIARRSSDDVSLVTYQKHVRIAWLAAAAQGAGASRHLIEEALLMAQRATQTDAGMAVQSMTARFAARDPRLQAMVRQREELESEGRVLEQRLSAVLAADRAKRAGQDETLTRAIAENSRRIADIDAELRRAFPEYFTLVQPAPVDIAKVRSLLAPDEALVVMFTGYDQTFVWAVTREDAAWHRVDLTVEQLEQAVKTMRDSLDVETFKESLRTRAKMFDLSLSLHIYTKLLGPIEPLIRDKRHLVTVPYGPLATLPLQVLITGGPFVALPRLEHLAMYQDAHWLVRRHAISVLPSVGSLEGLRVVARRPETRQRPMIGFGNPRFAPEVREATRGQDKRGSAQRHAQLTPTRSFNQLFRGGSVDVDALRKLPALPETEGELRTVARLLKAPESDLILGAAATESQVKQMDLTQFRIVYFATHGLVAGEIKDLQEPALALTPPARASTLDDGLLTASEVAKLRLNADWVVLAACNTAAGQREDSEALSGLARAFFYAGARALLVSHWRVGSEAAAKLTTSTFEAQMSSTGVGRAEALQHAMLAYMADRRNVWAAYPAFWAPFSVVGEGGL